MPSATLFYTAELPHPTDHGRTIMELDVAAEIDWQDGNEAGFGIYDVCFIEEVSKNGVRWNRRSALPLFIREWVRSSIEADRERIAKAIFTDFEDDVVTVPRTDGGRLSIPDPF